MALSVVEPVDACSVLAFWIALARTLTTAYLALGGRQPDAEAKVRGVLLPHPLPDGRHAYGRRYRSVVRDE